MKSYKIMQKIVPPKKVINETKYRLFSGRK